MSSEATILHADLDAFFASVEQRDDPRLRGRPVIVGPGVVQAASYEARAFGVRSAMGGSEARRLCPQAIVVEPRWSAYVAASRAVFEVFEHTAPVVEGLSIDEAFLDVRGLRADLGVAHPDRGEAAPRGAPESGPAAHRGGGHHEVPREGGERGGQARRPAGDPRRRGAGLPASAARGAPVGCWPGHRRQAPRARPPDRRAGGRDRRAGPGVDARARRRPPAPRALSQPRSAPGPASPGAPLVRRPVRARPLAVIARGAGRRARGPGGPRHAPHEGQAPGGTHRGAADAVRRLQPCHPVPHSVRGHGHHPNGARPPSGRCWRRPCR